MNSSTNLRKPGKFVNAPVMKKDAMALVTGKPVYMDDVAPKDCLVVKVLRSPHAHALIKEIRTDLAEKVDGIVCVLTCKKMFQNAALPWQDRLIRSRVRMTVIY